MSCLLCGQVREKAAWSSRDETAYVCIHCRNMAWLGQEKTDLKTEQKRIAYLSKCLTTAETSIKLAGSEIAALKSQLATARNDALEEAAKHVEAMERRGYETIGMSVPAIRALKEPTK